MWRFIICLMLASVSYPKFSHEKLYAGGNEGAHGGDWISSEFTVHGQRLISLLKNNPANTQLLTADKLKAFIFAVQTTPVNATDEILRKPNGDPADALTVVDPSSLSGKAIRLHRQRWDNLLNNKVDVYRLVFHEYLQAAGINDDEYRISRHLNTDRVNQVGDNLAGTAWTNSSSAKGVTVEQTVLFDELGGYRSVVTITDSSDFGIRGMHGYGSYTLHNNNVTLQRLGSSCPLPNASIGRIETKLVLRKNTLVAESLTGDVSLGLSKVPNEVGLLAGYINWGCLSDAGTFTAYANAVQLGRPISPLPNDLPIARQNDTFQAIAYSFSTGFHGSSWNHYTAQNALRNAMENCNRPDCKIMAWSTNSCTALAVSTLERKGKTAWNVDRQKAEDSALQECNRDFNNTCHLVASACPKSPSNSNPVETQSQQPLELSTPLTIYDKGSAIRYEILWTDQAGHWGNVYITGETGKRTYYLNPGRRAVFNISGGATSFCYDTRLKNAIELVLSGTAITYCAR